MFEEYGDVSFHEAVQIAVNLYHEQPPSKKDLMKASIEADKQSGGIYNVGAIQTAAYKQINSKTI